MVQLGSSLFVYHFLDYHLSNYVGILWLICYVIELTILVDSAAHRICFFPVVIWDSDL